MESKPQQTEETKREPIDLRQNVHFVPSAPIRGSIPKGSLYEATRASNPALRREQKAAEKRMARIARKVEAGTMPLSVAEEIIRTNCGLPESENEKSVGGALCRCGHRRIYHVRPGQGCEDCSCGAFARVSAPAVEDPRPTLNSRERRKARRAAERAAKLGDLAPGGGG